MCLATREMPKYECHKQVWALKIKKLDVDYNGDTDTLSATITPEEDGYMPFAVDELYLNKHNPSEGGYFVVYTGGYKSFSPADAFEDGYTKA